ncbi:MAG TPA: glycosyltransferase family A protein [Gemmataceae bacterium]|nr:glycosyltransferase family A protein [Gemmataceae bacterium]
MSEPSVSVIIPAYRAAATIGRAIDSLLAQTRTPNEIIVIDDGSPDDMTAALAPYGERVRRIRQANSGAASARNRGIDLAQGELIAFLDADDYWEPNKLQHQLAILERHPEVGLIAAHSYVQSPGQPRTPINLPSPHLFDRVLKADGPETMMVAKRVWTSTVLVRRAVLGEQRFDTTLVTAEDVDLWIRLVLSTPVYLISEPLATGVLEAGSLSRSNAAADSRNMLAVIQRYAHVLGPRGVWAAKVLVYHEWAATHLGNGEARKAIGPAWQRATHQPWSARAWWIVFKSTIWAGKTWLM